MVRFFFFVYSSRTSFYMSFAEQIKLPERRKKKKTCKKTAYISFVQSNTILYQTIPVYIENNIYIYIAHGDRKRKGLIFLYLVFCYLTKKRTNDQLWDTMVTVVQKKPISLRCVHTEKSDGTTKENSSINLIKLYLFSSVYFFYKIESRRFMND